MAITMNFCWIELKKANLFVLELLIKNLKFGYIIIITLLTAKKTYRVLAYNYIIYKINCGPLS